ncbi:glucose dehydrogenase [Seiridium cupressi]
MFYDYIIAGGGLAGTVIASRLHQRNPQLKIILIEAGGDPLKHGAIIMPDPSRPLHLIGGQFDWNISTVPQAHVNGRAMSLPQGKGLGGSTIINASGWVRGDRRDYDAWGEAVGDSRWGYEGLLPFMKKSERYPFPTVNADQHGYEGPSVIQTTSSIKRAFPLREKVLASWIELGVEPISQFDGNAGNQVGLAEQAENRDRGRRQVAPDVYPIDGVTVKLNTMVEKVLLEEKSDGSIVATGVKLGDGSELHGRQVIISAGAIRTPQILMLSGIGPGAELDNHGIKVFVDSPEVGRNLIDHTLASTSWKLKNPENACAFGSSNPLFRKKQYGWGAPCDFIATTDVPKEGLARAIEVDEGVKPDPSTHPLLKQSRPFLEFFFLHAGAPDGSAVMLPMINLHQTSRGTVKLDPANINGTPLVDPNYLGTEVDKYVHREMFRQAIAFSVSDATVIGREIVDSEIPPPGAEPLTTKSLDAVIDERVRASLGTAYHLHGTAAMGKVVDTELRVKGVKGLRVVDASVIPVNMAAHIQVPLYALAEQVAELIANETAA